MVAPLPQEINYKREFDAARREAAGGNIVFSPSLELEDFTDEGASAAASDPLQFNEYQRRARMEQGIGAPALLPEDIAALPDPEYADVGDDEDPITYGDSLNELEAEAREAEDIEEVQAVGEAIRTKQEEAFAQAAEKEAEESHRKMHQAAVKAITNGAGAVGIAGFDGWITEALTFIYKAARAVVTLFAPPSLTGDDGDAKKKLHAFIPPYHPLQQPEDFLQGIGAAVAIGIIVVFLIVGFLFMAYLQLFPFLIFATLNTTS